MERTKDKRALKLGDIYFSIPSSFLYEECSYCSLIKLILTQLFKGTCEVIGHVAHCFIF